VEHWKFIKDSRDPATFNGFIEQFPTSTFVKLARSQLSKLAADEAWSKVCDRDDIAGLQAFARTFVDDPRVAEANSRIAVLRSQAEERVARIKLRAETLLKTQYVSDAIALIQELGGRVEEPPGFFSRSCVVYVFQSTARFNNQYEMTQWTMKTLATQVIA